MLSIRTHCATVLAILALAQSSTAEVLYVDTDALFCQYSNLQTAVNAAADGDIIYVSPDQYISSNLTITGKSLSIVGLPSLEGDLPNLQNVRLRVNNLGANSKVLIAQLRVQRIDVVDCNGNVSITDCEITGTQYQQIENSLDVRFHNCELNDGSAFNGSNVGIRAFNSRVEVVDCDLMGDSPGNFIAGGTSGIFIDPTSRVNLSSSRIFGHDGNNLNFNGGPGVDCQGELLLSGFEESSLVQGGNPVKGAIVNGLSPSAGDGLLLGSANSTLAFAHLSGSLLIPGITFGNNAPTEQAQLYDIAGNGPFGPGKKALPVRILSGTLSESVGLDPSLVRKPNQDFVVRGEPNGIVRLHFGSQPTVGFLGQAVVESLVVAEQTFDVGLIPRTGKLPITLSDWVELELDQVYWIQASVEYAPNDQRLSNSFAGVEARLYSDCNNNDVIDACEPDCNGNGIPDECDLSEQTSSDVNANQIPDECEQVFYVSKSATGRNDGTDWENAFVELQAALEVASFGDMLWVAQGRYFPDFDPQSGAQTGERQRSFSVDSGMVLLGGFAGNELSADQRDPDKNPTLLSGDIGTPGDSADNSYHIMLGTSLNEFTRIEGFNFIGGNANGPNSQGFHRAGALFLAESQARVSHCNFINCRAVFGGAVNSTGGAEIFANCTFVGCSAAQNGGALSLVSGNTKLASVEIRNCEAMEGAAVYSINSQPDVFNGLIVNNIGTDRGVISSRGGLLRLINCGVYGNDKAVHARADGSVNIRNSIVWGNTDEVFDAGTTSSDIELLFSHAQAPAKTMGTGAVVEDPLLSNFDDGNYELLAGSGCIDSGKFSFIPEDFADLDEDFDTLELAPLDLAGQPRRIDSLDTPDTGPGQAPDVDRGPFERQFADCNQNGIEDSIDIAGALSSDCDQNGTPDECQADCDANGIPDICEILSISDDLDQNGLLDLCQGVLYVDANAGSGQQDGSSWANAFVDLPSALAAVQPNDQIWITGDTYILSSTIDLPSQISIFGGLMGIEQSLPSETPTGSYTIFEPTGSAGLAELFTASESTFLRGLQIQNAFRAIQCNSGFDPSQIRECRFFQCSFGLLGSFRVSKSIFEECTFGCTCQGTNVVQNCIFTRNGNAINSPPFTALSAQVSNCLFYRNVSQELAPISMKSECIMTNCTLVLNSNLDNLYGNPNPAITGNEDFVLRNCIIWENDLFGDTSFDNQVSIQAQMENCLLPGLTGSGFDNGSNIDAQPMFVNAASNDFHLLLSSPAVDSGNNNWLALDDLDLDQDINKTEPISLDVDGNPRQADSPAVPDTGVGTSPIVDLGCYEAQ